MSTTATTTILSEETFQEGPATRTRIVTVPPPTTTRSFFQKHPGWALAMYVFPFLLILVAHRYLGIPRNAAVLATASTSLLLAIGLGKDLPAVVNPLIASMPVLVVAAYAAGMIYMHKRK